MQGNAGAQAAAAERLGGAAAFVVVMLSAGVLWCMETAAYFLAALLLSLAGETTMLTRESVTMPT